MSTPAHYLSAAIHARARLVGRKVGTFGRGRPDTGRDPMPHTAEDVLGPTNAVRRAGETARRNTRRGGGE